MIDLQRAVKEFNNYIAGYGDENPKIRIKKEHTFRTMAIAQKIAKDLQLEKEQIELAGLIGLLHDIGRFEQVKRYDTFSDKDSIDHASLGLWILFQEGLIRTFIQEDTYDSIIYQAIQNHNRFKIKEGLTKEELIQAKIIRDADKTDIFFVFVQDIENGENVLYQYDRIAKQKVSPGVMEKFEKRQQANRDEFQSQIDAYINMIGFLFDYNFITGLHMIKENQYIEKMMKPICTCQETKTQMEKIMMIAHQYIDERIQKGW